jgi:tetratricopeptide (TPR) repeat protein
LDYCKSARRFHWFERNLRFRTGMDSDTLSDEIRSLEHDIEDILNNRQVEKEGKDSRLSQLEKNLSLLFFKRFRDSSEIEDVRSAAAHAREALDLHPQDDNEKQTLQVNLGNMQFMEYRTSKDSSVLDEAISNLRAGIHLPFKDGPQKISLLQNFWLVLKPRIAQVGTLQDVQEGIDSLREALNTEDSYSHLGPDIFRDLLALYLMKFDLVDNYPDLDAAITTAENAIRFTPHEEPEREIFLHNLATFLDHRFRLKEKQEDLRRSVRIWRQLVDSAEPATRRSRISLNGLSLALHNKYLLTGDVGDLEEAIRIAREAIEGLRDGDEAQNAVLMNLGLKLAARFDLLGKDVDIEEAIHFGHKAVTAATNDRERLRFLNNLATFYCSRYAAKGEVADMDTAVNIGRQLVEKSSDDDYAKSVYSGNLSSWLQDRYDATGALIDLQEAIDYGRQSLLDDSAPRMDQVIYKNNLAERLSRWYTRTEEYSALEEAIALMRQVIDGAGSQHPMRTIYINNLGNYLGTKFDQSKRPEDINEAILLGKQILADTPSNVPIRANFLNSQGSRYHDKFTQSTSKADLDDSISLTREATKAVDPRHPTAVIFRNNLGILLRERFQKYNTDEDRNEAKICLREALDHQTGPLIARIWAGLLGGRLHAEDREWPAGFDALQAAVLLLRRVSPRSIARDDQQQNLSGLSGISALTCSVALEAGKTASESLEILESGRAIISGLSTQMNEDVFKLEILEPDLCARYKELREKAFNASQVDIGNEVDEKENLKKQLQERPLSGRPHLAYKAIRENFEVLEELDKLEDEIRGMPGLTRFQLPPSSDQIMSMASPGPIVCFNVTEFRSDAILITRSDISAIRLNDLLYSDLESKAQLLTGKNRVTAGNYLGSKADRNRQLHDVLEWLWKVAVKPVLEILGLLTKPKSDPRTLPRIYWMASGQMGMMPLHAAGTHDRGSTENTMSYVVSTYITTLKAFAYAQERCSKQVKLSEQRILVVTMPTTPGKRPIKATEEAEALAKVCARFDAPNPNVLKHPSKSDVKENIAHSTMAHFACHGNSDAANPSRGGLFLGHEDASVAEHLSIAELAAMRPQDAQLAYLSACSTAENLAEKLVDEVIHTASSFQLLGFPHVIGTLWEAGNSGAIKIAEEFYGSLIENSIGGVHGAFSDDVAFSLHKAVQTLRENGTLGVRKKSHPRLDVISWAPFIHIGA